MATKCARCPLRRLEMFVPMSPEEVRVMDRFKVGELTVDAGTPILQEGSNALQLFTVLRGIGIRYKTTESGRRQVINFVFPGDFLGLQGSVREEMTHSIEARSKMTLCVFNRSELFGFIKNNPERAYDIIWACATEEHFLGEALTTLGQRTAMESVAWAVLRLFERAEGLGLVENATVELPLRQQDLADALGLSLVHTNKTLSKLRERQFIGWTDGHITVPDTAKLADVAGVEVEAAQPRPLM
ncbi:Crp/Fnr family transcriptional regulator [Salipiger sp. IMCC34102]|uniref:Crp/Fnr family transcriptional regulator n=1 Tax=Salipiger sp. IMCC34102 TaxID=2510647 RepID=UPI00101B69E1|nr:Crp/Fnr family transcriptional regulator [Salipiger sp. IMCC34102]RYH03899.1 Crp/Fnr family transcriptional regulator [Salipiger sp. IMCC34102]